jgi:MFS family permease
MGWSRAGISAASMLAFLCLGVSSFARGAASDRYGTRAVVLAGGVLLGVGLAAASQAVELWQFQALFGVLVGSAAGSSYTPLIATTTNWFTQHRSLAVALVSVGLGLGAVTVAPLATWIILEHGWRTRCRCSAASSGPSWSRPRCCYAGRLRTGTTPNRRPTAVPRSAWRRRCERRSSWRSHSRTSPAARRIPGRSSAWSATLRPDTHLMPLH